MRKRPWGEIRDEINEQIRAELAALASWHCPECPPVTLEVTMTGHEAMALLEGAADGEQE